MADKIVYSTGPDRPSTIADTKDKKNKKNKKQNTSSPPSGIKKDGIIRVQKESKGRGGKTVSIIYSLPLKGSDLSELARTLQKKCGTGGTVKDGSIIIQGDKVNTLVSLLQAEGYTVKRAGG